MTSAWEEMASEQLDAEWRAIEDWADEHRDVPEAFHTVRALYILRERVRRLEAELRELKRD